MVGGGGGGVHLNLFETKLFHYDGVFSEKSGKINEIIRFNWQLEPSCKFDPPVKKSWISPCNASLYCSLYVQCSIFVML